ncbi:transposon Ty3-I Gag-Pol polyprotein isoform X2 [Hevea brasiliensis]|uniref:transposon Ty3-I Gag-Pol polyprotein isoform X2 n=1 Tax=Hevea brasiliensis TaxID=3981 RepID=UPI0025E1A276|nr:transposon Ty3-I Gag-Pol polyprotein isoform X2 [Hevea brasiliensis]
MLCLDGVLRSLLRIIVLLCNLSLIPAWMSNFAATYEGNVRAEELIQQFSVAVDSISGFAFKSGLLYYEGRLFVGCSTSLRSHLISLYHNSPLGGHSVVLRTSHKLKKHFHWPWLKEDVVDWIKKCDQCARCKGETCATPGLLQPIPIPNHAWQYISMDFVEQLRKSLKDTILVVCRFTKHAHFMALSHPILLLQLQDCFWIMFTSWMGHLKLLFQTDIRKFR